LIGLNPGWRQNFPPESGLMCADPVHYPYSIVVDGPEEMAVDKSLATIFEHTNFLFQNQRHMIYPPKISTSLPTDFVRNFCRLFQHSGKSRVPAVEAGIACSAIDKRSHPLW